MKDLKTILEAFDENAARIMYTDYSKERLGCCGGDYCEGNHNDNIRKFITQTYETGYADALKEVIEKMPKFVVNECSDDYPDGYNSALSDLKDLITLLIGGNK